MSDYILVTKDLTKKYGNSLANDKISISIKRGEICGFIGKNGSGKTTFIRLITELIKPTEGSFELFGKSGKCKIGAVVEKPSFFNNMNAYQNLEYQARLLGLEKEISCESLLKMVGLNTDKKDRKKVKSYSLGMRQRLGIAIALLGEPEFLILDEPANGLDPQGIIEIRKLLIDLATDQGITILISSHILGELSRLATTYCFINNGQIIERISANDLKSKLKKRLNVILNRLENVEVLMEKLCQQHDIEGFRLINKTTIQLINPHNIVKSLMMLEEEGYQVISLESHNDDLESYYINLIGGTIK